MPRLLIDEKYYSPREVNDFISNTVIVCTRAGRSVGGKGELIVKANRMGRLREFAEALIEPFDELLREGGITPEELRIVLAGALKYYDETYCGEAKRGK